MQGHVPGAFQQDQPHQDDKENIKNNKIGASKEKGGCGFVRDLRKPA